MRIWDLDAGTGKVVGTHAQPIRALAISRSGRWLASGDKGGGLRLWRLPEGTLVRVTGLVLDESAADPVKELGEVA